MGGHLALMLGLHVPYCFLCQDWSRSGFWTARGVGSQFLGESKVQRDDLCQRSLCFAKILQRMID